MASLMALSTLEPAASSASRAALSGDGCVVVELAAAAAIASLSDVAPSECSPINLDEAGKEGAAASAGWLLEVDDGDDGDDDDDEAGGRSSSGSSD